MSGGSHSIDAATAEHPAVEPSGFAPPVADPPPFAAPDPADGPGPADAPRLDTDPSSSAEDAGAPAPKVIKLPTGGVEALERPEGQVGLAFAGGFLAALILKRLVG